MNNFAVLTLWKRFLPTAILFVTTTNNPVHLTLYYTDKCPLRHKTSRNERGLTLPWGAYYCFVAWKSVEQQEPGDTLTHTFYVPDWLPCQTKWFTFRGTVATVLSPSSGPIIELHHPYLLTCPIKSTDGWMSFSPGNYPTQHNSPVASWIQDGAVRRYLIGQWHNVWGLRVVRMGWFFDTSALKPTDKIVSAEIRFHAIRVGPTPFDAVLVNGTGLDEPLQFANFGYLLNQTAPFGSTPLQTVIDWHYIELTQDALDRLVPGGTTKYGLRSSLDIAYQPPTGVEFAYIYPSNSGVPPDLTIAYNP